MGIFNYIDTFFFISLGITFVLILLLVFHFKQQIVSLDHKNDTMFEIINNIVKEITYLKSVVFSHPPYHLNDHDEIINLTENHIQSKHIVENKIVVSDEEEHDSDDETDVDENSDDETDVDEDSDDDSIEDTSDNDDEYQDTNDNNDTVKVINIEIGENIEVSEEIAELSDNNDNDDNNDDNDNNNDNELNQFEENKNITIEETESIIVEKLDTQDNHLENNKENDQEKQIESIKEVYRKMTLIQLKALVISKGLTSDSSKMRKPELLKLLESNIDENN